MAKITTTELDKIGRLNDFVDRYTLKINTLTKEINKYVAGNPNNIEDQKAAISAWKTSVSSLKITTDDAIFCEGYSISLAAAAEIRKNAFKSLDERQLTAYFSMCTKEVLQLTESKKKMQWCVKQFAESLFEIKEGGLTILRTPLSETLKEDFFEFTRRVFHETNTRLDSLSDSIRILLEAVEYIIGGAAFTEDQEQCTDQTLTEKLSNSEITESSPIKGSTETLPYQSPTKYKTRSVVFACYFIGKRKLWPYRGQTKAIKEDIAPMFQVDPDYLNNTFTYVRADIRKRGFNETDLPYLKEAKEILRQLSNTYACPPNDAVIEIEKLGAK